MQITMTIEASGVYRRTADVVSRQVGAETILVPVRQNVGSLDSIYTLSAVAARVWDLLDGSRTVEQIIDVLCAEFEVERDRAAADVTELIEDLHGISLVQPSR
jgi:hypothetical protein